jgi:hypothetical protein
MKYVHYKSIGASVVLAATVASAACTSKKETQFVAGLKTQVQIPRDLRSVVVRVSSGGDLRFCRAYPVTKGKAELPQSLGTRDIQLDQDLPIEIIVAGLSTGITSTGNICPNTFKVGDRVPALDLGSDGETADSADGQIRVFRRSVQQYVPGRAIYIPMPIWYSCFDRDCTTPEGTSKPLSDPTCKAGRCVASAVDPKKLAASVNYSKSLGDSLHFTDTNETSPLLKGVGNQCFRARTAEGVPGCFDAVLPPKVIDAATCLFEIVEVPNIPFRGVNVEAIFEGGFVREILDQDEEEGFFLPDAKNPKRFQLAPGLCDAYNGRKQDGYTLLHPITAINASSVCPAKTVLLPLCYDEEVKKVYGENGTPAPSSGARPGQRLAPTPSGLVILFDATEGNKDAFASGGIADLLTSVALKDPALDAVSMGLTLLPDADQRCEPKFAVAPATGDATRQKIRDALALFTGEPGLAKLRKKTDPDLGVAGAIGGATQALSAPNYDRRAVVVIGNGPFGSGTCNADPSTFATTGRAKGITTHVVFTKGATVDEAGEAAKADAIASSGGSGKRIDTVADPNAGINAFVDIATDLTTCHYDFAKDKVVAADDTIAFYDRVQRQEVSIIKSATCTEEGGAGWLVKDGRIVLCKDSCATLQKSVKDALKFAIVSNATPAATEVYLRKH